MAIRAAKRLHSWASDERHNIISRSRVPRFAGKVGMPPSQEILKSLPRYPPCRSMTDGPRCGADVDGREVTASDEAFDEVA